ncbi:hypothetical protein C4D60_Mb06t23110 [Musa balbisiana]|uniref:BHLH domain-containing protein n=1 Tax=Musa balbisiana TaxID=52838 RepID=A0A4S8IQ61_MUSBA|nr:hypothetical protein C4D60_Mb06t23110 [Musa balbisiana]
MSRGTYQSSIVQQMMGRSPSLWSMNNNLMPPSQEMSTLLASSSSSPSPLSSSRMENWEYQLPYTPANAHMVDVKQEGSEVGHHAYYHGKEQGAQVGRSSWSQMVPASSPRSCVTTSFSNNILDFSNCKSQRKHHQSDLSSECNSNSGAALKKARVQASSAQSSLKVRKEKLGDRIAALHQLVSPFGKRLILLHPILNPLLRAGSEFPVPGQQIKEHEAVRNGMLIFQGKGESSSSIFVEDPGVQLLSADSCMKRRGPPADQVHRFIRAPFAAFLCLSHDKTSGFTCLTADNFLPLFYGPLPSPPTYEHVGLAGN